MAQEKILIVEDDCDIVEMIEYNLKKEGYRTISVKNGEDAVSLIKTKNPNLVLLDLMLPGIDGLEVCRRVRGDEASSLTPIIMLTAKSQEADKVVGLEIGADDYMTKPFSPRELLARIRALLRRSKFLSKTNNFNFGDITIDVSKHKVVSFGKQIELTHTEFKILELMARRPGVVLSRDKILNDVFDYASAVYDRTVDTHIKSLRKKLGPGRKYIETIRGLGYRFRE